MGRRKYYFPYIAPGQPLHHVAVTSKSLMERNGKVSNIFEKYTANSNQQCPRKILYRSLQMNESLFLLKEPESSPKSDSTSPSTGLQRPGRSVSLSRRKQNTPLKIEKRSDDQTVLKSPKRKDSSTIYKALDLSPRSRVQAQQYRSKEDVAMLTSSPATAVKKVESPIKTPQKDVDPTTYAQESVSSGRKDKMGGKSESSGCSEIFKIPSVPFKYKQDVSEFVTPVEKVKTLSQSPKDDKMDISSNKGDKMSESPSKEGKTTAISPEKSKSLQTLQSPFSSIPRMKDDETEMDTFSKSNENLDSPCTSASAEIGNLVDDPSRVEDIRSEVESRKQAMDSLKKTKKETTIMSPRVLSHPNVLAYLKSRFQSILLHRNNYMLEIKDFFTNFDCDVRFLFDYSADLKLTVNDILIEGKAYFTESLANSKADLMRIATRLSNTLCPLIDSLKSDIIFWTECLNEVEKLNKMNEPLLSPENASTTVELLREYESNLRIVWKKMDSRILLRKGCISSLLRTSADFIKLTKDFGRYLVKVELLKPSPTDPSEHPRIL